MQDAVEHARLPAKLSLSWRQGYTAPKSRSAALPPQLAPALLAYLALVHPSCPLVAGRQAAGEHSCSAAMLECTQGAWAAGTLLAGSILLHWQLPPGTPLQQCQHCALTRPAQLHHCCSCAPGDPAARLPPIDSLSPAA